ncbi:hypothetical protein HYH38_16130 [Clostridium botulinum]|uniref:hypothetical protein n=1 Tax=Clostridium botulinum TaxID=1491 RepID=UPI00155DD816|nr:hypothetical protein [Clostridium botulinum]MBY6810992.1 hypothetical protein [Clostridium botulinum]MBY6818469.1 hypothetical protein [Clostridium botulinum]MBY6824460.1 hypothetical protein [Clostridium botulinum]MBY6828763.1 hypothetical protein [Clostridium botulinum]MBY6832692.1 hypothetical protein [Clostridium botulinum]
MKILLKKSIIDLNELKELKINNKVTFNNNDYNVDIIIEDNKLSFKNYKDYSIDYTHWSDKVNLAFIVSVLEETLAELTSMNF